MTFFSFLGAPKGNQKGTKWGREGTNERVCVEDNKQEVVDTLKEVERSCFQKLVSTDFFIRLFHLTFSSDFLH